TGLAAIQPIAEPAKEATPPALHPSTGKERAGVFSTRRGGSGGGDSSDRRCRRGKNACAAPVAALSVLGVPPAVHPAVLQQHAGVFGTRGQGGGSDPRRSEEHTSELQSRSDLVCRLLLEKK